MSISETHPYYNKTLHQWEKIRNSFDGSDAIKGQGVKYLPILSGQGTPEYNAYKMRAVYFNAVERTVQGLVGAVMRIEPLITVPKVMNNWLDNITNTGVTLNNFISYMLSEQLLTNRQGILIDHGNDRPYLVGYSTEQMTNWLDDTIVLKETYTTYDQNDKYKITYRTQYRELTIIDGNYTVVIWRERGNAGTEWVIVDIIVPLSMGKPLQEIPFFGLSNDGFNMTSSVSSLLALSDMSLSLYRTSADLEHGRHFTALPTPWIIGNDAKGEEGEDTVFGIGSGTVWNISNEKASVGYLEFTGQGLTALENAVKEKKEMMASLGSQLLQSQKAGVEAADSIRLRQNAEASTLVSVVKIVEKGIERALQTMADWAHISGEIKVELNTDFVDMKMAPAELSALMSAWQAGAISHDTLLYNMKKGELLDSEVDIETEKALATLQAGQVEQDAIG